MWSDGFADAVSFCRYMGFANMHFVLGEQRTVVIEKW